MIRQCVNRPLRTQSRSAFGPVALAFLSLVLLGSGASASTVTIRTGNAPVGQPDPLVTILPEPSGLCGAGFPLAFTPADFAAAASGPASYVITNFAPWVSSLSCDPLAGWVTPFANSAARSALFAQSFVVPAPCCIQQATLSFCWAMDDWLGDLDTFTNAGVFLNGTALPITGGSYAAETQAVVDVTGVLRCGTNTLYVYDRDAGCAVSGLMYSATFLITECAVSVEQDSWGRVKALYR
jgi:hypothetical protein